ncbi:MAG: alginate biosynthesis two-component system sensor histidine kinase AlgZ [Wenzhouxiangellaceae bacterium]
MTATNGDNAFTFCSWLLLFAGMLAAEVGVLIPALAPGSTIDLFHLGVMSLYAQWINILALSTLCLSESWLLRLPRQLAWLGAWLLVVMVATLVATAVGWFDQMLNWGLTDYRWPLSHFVLRSTAISGLLAGVVLRYLAVHRSWQRGLRAQEQVRFNALQMRIQPHFLFNSLNSIAALTTLQPERAEHAIENLADLLRGSLRDPQQTITLQQELALCRNYLEIEALRLGERLRIQWHEKDLPQSLPVPPLLLQPLIENAIIHGIQQLPEGGELSIRNQTDDQKVIFEISNPLSHHPQPTDQPGIALANLRARLELCYGGSARLDAGVRGEQFIARLQLPRRPPNLDSAA